MSTLAFLLGVLFMATGIAASIALHEVGHLVPAKRFGVRVTQYMVGFGPTMWSRRRGETEYGVKAIPLGGYIAMSGMYPPTPGGRPRNATTSFLDAIVQEGGGSAGTLVEAAVEEASGESSGSKPGRVSSMIQDAREQSAETILPGEDHRAFYRLPIGKRIVVMLGGPLMNLLLAIVAYAIVLCGFGAGLTYAGTYLQWPYL